MTTNPFPYNITLPSGTASIRYRPFRDGDPNAGWNVSYPSGTKLYSGLGGTQGIGAGQSQTTFPGATIEFEWIGMAIYLYGTASSSDAYQISIDSQDIGIGQESESGLLGSKTGLVYGQHSVTLLARGGGEVVFRNAVVTIGMRRSRCVMKFSDQFLIPHELLQRRVED
ncbi:hypothetical protein L218DRAFT_931099 [Marasmius fiardii PR-910]|nr:hypothetical protein L218DRAFT_931099 [Marasmius fiardii PR-910]